MIRAKALHTITSEQISTTVDPVEVTKYDNSQKGMKTMMKIKYTTRKMPLP